MWPALAKLWTVWALLEKVLPFTLLPAQIGPGSTWRSPRKEGPWGQSPKREGHLLDGALVLPLKRVQCFAYYLG